MKQYLKMLYGPFAKKGADMDIDSEQRIVGGYFTDDKVDLYGHIIDRAAMVRAIADYADWGNIREMHDKPVGVAKSVGERDWNYIEAQIVPDDTWALVEAGVYKGFSVGIIVTDAEFVSVEDIPENKFDGLPESIASAIKDFGEVLVITGLELVEVSIVDRPANPRAVIGTKGAMLPDAVLPSVVEGGEVLHKAFSMEHSEEKEVDKTDKAAEEVVEEISEVEAEAETEVEAEVESDTETEAEADEEMEAEADDEVEDTEEESVEEKDAATEDDMVVMVKAMHDVVFEMAATVQRLAELMTRAFDSADEEAEEDVEAEAEVEAEQDKGIDYDLIARLVVEKMNDRRGVVNKGVEEEDETIDIKSLGRSDLAKVIAAAAARRVSV